MRCKGHWLATVSALAILGAVNVASPATAADLPARMPVKAPAVVAPAPFSWTGFYVGIHGGGAWLDHRQTTLIPNGGCNTGSVPDVASDCTIKDFGAAVGGLAGYNFQSGRIVYGLEVDGSWLSVKRSEQYATGLVPTPPLTLHTKVTWLATVRGRLGITMSPTLLYVTGGAAFGGVKSGWFDGGTPPLAVTVDKTKAGWVVGGGIEHAFGSNWTARIEALYHDLGKLDAATQAFGNFTYSTTFRHKIVTARAALALRW